MSQFTHEDFITSTKFGTPFDGMPSNLENREKRYQDGLKVGKDAKAVVVGPTDVWSAQMKDGASLQSYERIGYHANTKAFWQGVLDSGVKVIVYRVVEGKLTPRELN